MEDAFTETYTLSKVFNAPLPFVYAWCTDFREDDSRMHGGASRRRFVERSRKRIIWTTKSEDGGKPVEGVRVVWLSPPDSWRLDTCGDVRERGDYALTSLGKNRTRLDMTFRVTYDRREDVESRESWEADGRKDWDAYARFLERDYGRTTKRKR